MGLRKPAFAGFFVFQIYLMQGALLWKSNFFKAIL